MGIKTCKYDRYLEDGVCEYSCLWCRRDFSSQDTLATSDRGKIEMFWRFCPLCGCEWEDFILDIDKINVDIKRDSYREKLMVSYRFCFTEIPDDNIFNWSLDDWNESSRWKKEEIGRNKTNRTYGFVEYAKSWIAYMRKNKTVYVSEEEFACGHYVFRFFIEKEKWPLYYAVRLSRIQKRLSLTRDEAVSLLAKANQP